VALPEGWTVRRLAARRKRGPSDGRCWSPGQRDVPVEDAVDHRRSLEPQGRRGQLTAALPAERRHPPAAGRRLHQREPLEATRQRRCHAERALTDPAQRDLLVGGQRHEDTTHHRSFLFSRPNPEHHRGEEVALCRRRWRVAFRLSATSMTPHNDAHGLNFDLSAPFSTNTMTYAGCTVASLSKVTARLHDACGSSTAMDARLAGWVATLSASRPMDPGSYVWRTALRVGTKPVTVGSTAPMRPPNQAATAPSSSDKAPMSAPRDTALVAAAAASVASRFVASRP
jgi:hypothetical protein